MFRKKQAENEFDIWDAASLGDLNAIKMHIHMMTDLNCTTEQGDTPLHFAAAHAYRPAQSAIIDFLLTHGADATIKNKHGLTAYDVIADSNNANAKKIQAMLLAAMAAQSFAGRLAAIGQDPNHVPDEYCDPVTLEIMEQPITVCSGTTYDRQSLQSLFEHQNHPETIECPMTRLLIIRVELDNPIDEQMNACIESYVSDLEKAFEKKRNNVTANNSSNATLFSASSNCSACNHSAIDKTEKTSDSKATVARSSPK